MNVVVDPHRTVYPESNRPRGVKEWRSVFTEKNQLLVKQVLAYMVDD